MIYLNKPGIYRVIGEQFELLIKVIGTPPTLRIISGIRMNDFVTTGKVVELKEDSVEIQEVMLNPSKFVFAEADISTTAEKKAPSMSLKGVKSPYINDEQFKLFVSHYINNVNIPGRGKNATLAFIMEETGWTVAQANCVILQIIRYVKKINV